DTYQMEKRYFHKLGQTIHIFLSVSLIQDGSGQPLNFVAQVQDITERKQAEERISASLGEKEVLLKEIHHRVKNNLQIVSTLLDLQSGHTADKQALTMFKESQGRVRSMALIHERLYRSRDLARVDFVQYVEQLAEDMYHAYRLSGDEIVLEVDVDVPPLPIDIAIPCGLLINELMSNALKHAFADVHEGRMQVGLHQNGEKMNVLTIADTGGGFPGGLDFRNTTSFGLQLVNTLVEQLNGKIELKSCQGTEFTVTFPDMR
ncbi:MAG TPA: histidine kinase dimerization/phosphoacceptor domain -containing protein, partial [Gemmataceae bacterium]|nr:histidine kinase dimerization/phosphoacceptor domain -containing protein [Gemmataceae bacterium]